MQKMALAVLTFLLVFCPALMHAKDSHSNREHGNKICKKERLSKIFANPEQILINQDGIFVYMPNKKLVQGKFIALENGEVYVAVPMVKLIPKRVRCNLHRIWHNECGGCGVVYCPMSCTCF